MASQRRRVLLVDSDKDEQHWLSTALTSRFQYLVVKTVGNREEAHQELLKQQYDVIVTDMLITPDQPGMFVCELLEIAINTPIIVLTASESVGESMLDVISLGVRHILYKEDIRKDINKLQAAIVDVIHDAARRENIRDTTNERVTAIARKVGAVDSRIFKMESTMLSIVDSIKNMTAAVDRRGGLEDRLLALERFKNDMMRGGMWLAGIAGTVLAAVIAGIFALLKH